MGRRARRADDGAAPAGGHGHAAHPPAGRRRRRPPAGADDHLHRGQRRDGARLRARLRLRPRAPAEWSLVGDDRHIADARGPHQTLRLQTDMAIGIEGNRIRARHDAARGRDGPTARCRGRPSSSRRQSLEDADARLDATAALLARLAGRRADPRPPLARGDPALGAGDQGPDVHADRRDRRGADDVAARDARRRAQLGLPLRLDARLDVHAAGAALAQPRLGSRGVHAVRRRPRARRRTARCRSCTGSTGAATSPSPRATTSRATPARARSGSATARSTSARTTSTARCWTASCCTPAAASGSRAGCGRSSRPRPSARRASGASPTRASGRRAARRSTTSPPSSCAGSRWIARPSSPRSAATPSASEPGARSRRRSAPTSSSTASASAACCASTTRTDALDASTLLAAIFGFLPGDDPRLRATVLAIADELTEHGYVLRYRTDETDDGLSGKEGTFLICSFWLVSALAIIGETAACARPDGASAARGLAARASTPRSSTPTPAATWGTSHRRSRTSR